MSIPINVGFDDVFKDYITGSMRLEAQRDKLNFGFDFGFTRQVRDRNIEPDIFARIRFTTLRTEGFVSYILGKLTQTFEPIVGFRYTRDDLNFQAINDTTAVSGPLKQDYLDPIVGARYIVNLSERTVLLARANVGGFGLGSKFSWDVNVGLGYRFSRWSYVLLQYKILDVDFESGKGEDFYRVQTREQGALLGLGFVL